MEISKVTTNVSNLLQSTLQVMHQHSFHHHIPFVVVICCHPVSDMPATQ
jgi:hypothetical protein